MLQARKDGTNPPNEPVSSSNPPVVQRIAVQQQADPRRTATYVAPTAVILQAAEGGGTPEGGGTVQYRRVSIAPQLQHVVAPVQVQASSSTSDATPLTVTRTITSAQDLANFLSSATTAAGSFHTVEVPASSAVVTTTTGGVQRMVQPQRLLVNSGNDVFALRLAQTTSGGTPQQIMVLDPTSIAAPTDVTKVHSYSLAPSAVQKISIGQQKATTVARVGVKRQLVTTTPVQQSKTHLNNIVPHMTFWNRIVFSDFKNIVGSIPQGVGNSSPKAKRIKLEKGVVQPQRDPAKKARAIQMLMRKFLLLKIKYYHLQLDTYFLKNGGNLVDYIVWRKSPQQQVLEYLKSNKLEQSDDFKVIQDCLAPTMSGLRDPQLPQISGGETPTSSSKALPSSQSSQRLSSAPQSPKGSRTPVKQHSKHNSISSVYDSQIGSQEEIVERAKQEAYVMQRVGDLRREGLWSLKRLPKVADAPRIKAHHDYLLEEMVWLATDFAQERKWKKAAAKKCARMITKYFQEKEIKAEKAEREEQMRLRKIASTISREIKQFWNNIEKLVEYKTQTTLDEKRKKIMDTHLNFIVDQTEKYSSWLTQGMNQPNSTPQSPQHSEDFSPCSSEDDEETIEKAEEGVDEQEQSEEIRMLQQESEMPLEDFLESLPKEMLTPAQDTGSKTDSEEKSDDEFQVSESEEDDEQTILEQEEGEGNVDHQEEIQELQAENEMSIEELRQKYSAAFTGETDMDTPEQRSSENESRSSDESSDEEEPDDKENSLLKELSSDATDPSGNPSKEISDIAATAESFQPKGNTLSTTQVCTKVPFLLKHQLREYQHIGLDWLNAMYEKKLNGILADEMGLGKTIQTISVLAHLACEKGVWGPHLIVVPTSVMLNWEMELKKWCPAFKILTYYGTPKERKQKRVGWTKPNAFHVCITSYKLVVQDHQSFRRKRWKYMILDEAQHIKNFKSQRWQMLLNFQSSHRLLLTGTPLQNNLMELWSLMHFLMPHVFQSHREFREWFCNPLTGMIEGSSDYNDSLVKRLHKVLRPFLLRRLKCEVEKQLPKKYEHIVICRLSNRQRYLYDDFMSQTKTKETLATGNFMSVINILMQLRKVCNHPNMFEERPTVSPFMMEGIRYTTASLAYKALDYDPFKQVSLLSLNLLLADLELALTAFAAHRVKKFQVPRKLIEEIDSLPEPPPPCPTFKMKVNFCNPPSSPAPSSSSPAVGTPRPAAPSTPRPPAVVPPRAAVVGPQRFMVFPGQQVRNASPAAVTPQPAAAEPQQQYTFQLLQPGAAIAPLSGGVTLQLQPAPSTTASTTGPNTANRVQCIQSLIGGIGVGRVVQTATGAFVITSVANSVADNSTTQPTTTTPLVIGANLATVVSQSQRMANPAVAPPFLSTFNRTPGPPNNRPVGRVAPFNGHPTPATTSETAVIQNHVQTPTKSPMVHSLSKPNPKLEVPTEKKDSIFYLDSLSRQKKQQRREALSTLARINSLRCSGCPIYGLDLIETVALVHSLKHPRLGSPWAGKGYVNCLNAVSCRDDPRRYWEHTSVLSQIVRTPEDRVEELCDVINRFVFSVPAVTAPPLEMHVSHPPPWKLQEERSRTELLSAELTPKSAFLHPITSNMNTQFPELRLIQYDCGKLQRLAHLLYDLKDGQHRVLIFTQMTRMLDILEQFLNYHGHTYLRLDGNTKVEQRQCLMERFNADKRIFCFILSTRSGGIGVNLTGADTVIFYDSDWNPTMDAQAQDRCHRIGQTRDVHIYRLISERTIEENILKKANQKRILGDLAIEGGNFTTAFFKKNTIHDLFGLEMQGDLKKVMAEEERLQEEKEKLSQKEFEQALGMAEEDSDQKAAQTASAEAVAELAEFDESIPLDQDSRDNEEKTPAEEELEKLMDQLSPIETYALKYLESLQEPASLEQLKQAEEEIEAQKKDWELGHLKALKQEEERLGDEDNPLFCSREASNQVSSSSKSRRSRSSLPSKTSAPSRRSRRITIKKEAGMGDSDDDCGTPPNGPANGDIRTPKKTVQTPPVIKPFSNPNLVIRTRRASAFEADPKATPPHS
ncbi:hypothetical protein JTE90_019444 [Oedothorax gibbosus]|uniref:Helicase domino n=1 Tax=Oedothorax gibbosus TaxID=931172 RepID=A0AAV6UVM0_9ARAC|nr:hypothetical protein JTE90_019444 [Oedothorax gibbosus]